MNDNDSLDVVVRFHDPGRLRELDRCIFSLVGQTYRPLNILLAVQRFTPEAVEATHAALAPLLGIEGAPSFSVLNWPHPEPPDARSALANMGIQAGRGRYLAFLDYDDVLYPEAYELLISRLRKTEAGIAFGGICVKRADVYESFLYMTGKEYPFKGRGVIDLFQQNFCPIHSFVIDRTRVDPQLLFFEPLMNRNEDYDLILRICAQTASDFGLMDTIIGEYALKNDGSNTILTESADTQAARQAWEGAELFMEGRRRTTPVSLAVQRALGVSDAVPGLTVAALLRGKNS